jgi:hypothetical protein
LKGSYSRPGETTAETAQLAQTTHVGMLRKSGIGCSSYKQGNEQQKMFTAHDFALSFLSSVTSVNW